MPIRPPEAVSGLAKRGFACPAHGHDLLYSAQFNRHRDVAVKLVEGQLEYLMFIRDFSGMSHSVATQGLRDFIRSIQQSQQIIMDVLPRWIMIEPMVNEDGTISGEWTQPEERVGRIVKGFG